ncbi:MAG: GNAT family N-acetyltransferase [Myxococcales bacterium]|nr:GNAT family N-acetyltransferase [Myxococcales bacterium]MCB9520735.1 GNAT family N-acetyltransferase [Myxococcales bacterium]
MPIAIAAASFADLAEYASISIAFEVRSTLVVDPRSAIVGAERPVAMPWTKDYDAVAPVSAIPREFDTRSWGCWVARERGTAVGGAIVAFDTPGVDMLEGRRDLAVLWDLRVAHKHRGAGIGGALVTTAAAWATGAGCCELRVETQDINVPACRFYERQGFRLLSVEPDAYPECPGETKLIWSRSLQAA